MRRPRLISVIVAVATAALLGGGITTARVLDPLHAARQQVVGYAEPGGATRAHLRSSAGILTTVGVDGINVTSDGAHLTPVSSGSRRLLAAAHAEKKPAELLVGNFDGVLDDFSPDIGDRLLGSRANIRAVVKELAAVVRRQHWDGVTVDLESLTDEHPSGLTSFVAQLKGAVGAGTSVSVCLMATPDDYASEGYDLRGLGRAADHVVLMAYDQHGPTWSKAGPVGGRPWVEASLKPLLATIPASKVQLGVAGYGYTWPEEGDGEQVSDARARSMVHDDSAVARWVPAEQEWTATLSNGTVLWWSDAKTFALRKAYAARLHLGGVAVWSLGLSDALT
jgi:spore germination protein